MADADTLPEKRRDLPRYLQLASELREAILSGAFTDSAPFPTETVLCARYDVSRFTVREALKRLQAEGLIARRRGSGTVVQPAAARGGALHQPLSNVGELLQYAQGSAVVYEHVDVCRLPSSIAEQISADTEGDWTMLSGVRRQGFGEKPIATTDVYFAGWLGDIVDKLDLNASSQTLFSQIERIAGVTFSTVTQDIQAVAATKQLAEKLEIKKGSPVLCILRCYVDGKGRVFEISVSHHPGDRFVYAMHIDVEN